MIPIIKERQRITETTYDYVFEWKGEKGSGFSFPCDKDGKIKYNELAPEAIANLKRCTGELIDEYDICNKVVEIGVRPYTHSWTEPAKAKCHCGHVIYLDSFTNTCEKCGRDYNMSGQELAPREQWGEETGETADEILSIGHTIS